MRLIAWNIRAGGGVRAPEIVSQLKAWRPDIVLLSEFRGTPASQSIAKSLFQSGLRYQRSTTDQSDPVVNSLLIASHWPLRKVSLSGAPSDPHRWLHVNVSTPHPFAILGVHIPNRSTGRKYPFMDAVLGIVESWRGPPAVLMGDTNSGRINIDEESSAFSQFEHDWMQRLNDRDWSDAFRLLHGERREFTWYSPNKGNGFRLDQMFMHPSVAHKANRFRHEWGGRGGGRIDRLSDHAALILDIGA